MSAAQMAHWLKEIGKGNEWTGILSVYKSGWLVGAGQTLLAVGGIYCVYRLGKWGYVKVQDYLSEHGSISVPGEVM